MNSTMNKKKDKLAVVPWFFLAFFAFLLSVTIALAVIPRSLAAQVTMEVYQQEGRKAFGKDTSLDIFNDPKLGDQKLVHPFSKGAYTFAVYNNSNSDPLPYALSISGTNLDDIPLVFSLQKNGEYIYGGNGSANMKPFSEINLAEALIGGKKTDRYTIKWEWKTDNDAQDTAIGSNGTQLYTLVIKAIGTIPDTLVPRTGYDSGIFVWVVVVLSAVSMLFILLFLKRKKDEDEDHKALAEDL